MSISIEISSLSVIFIISQPYLTRANSKKIFAWPDQMNLIFFNPNWYDIPPKNIGYKLEPKSKFLSWGKINWPERAGRKNWLDPTLNLYYLVVFNRNQLVIKQTHLLTRVGVITSIPNLILTTILSFEYPPITLDWIHGCNFVRGVARK